QDRLVREHGAEVALERAVRRVLRRREGDAALRRQAGRRLEHTVEQLLRRVDGADQPDPQRLLGVDGAAGEDQVLRQRRADRAGEALGPAPAGDDREVDLRLSEGGALRRVADVARERELAATAEREAVDG